MGHIRSVSRVLAAGALVATAAFVAPMTASAAVTPLMLESVSFSDAQHGMITGGYGNMTGLVSATSDGGRNWHAVRVDPNRWYRAGAAGTGSGSRVLADEFGGYVWRTPDFGANWSVSGPLASNITFLDADMANATRGWLVGRGGSDPGSPAVIYTTDDGGQTWTKTYAGWFYWASFGDVPYLTSNAWLRCVDGADADTAWALGLMPGSRTLIRKTEDGGASWTTQTISGIDPEIYGSITHMEVWDVSAPSTSTAYAVGVADRLYWTTDGGTTWQVKVMSDSTKVLYGISMVSASTGWAVGSGGRVFKTTDGWATRVQQAALPKTARAVYAVDADTVWVVGDDEMIMYSADGGTTWQGCPSNRPPSARVTGPSTGTVLTGATCSVTGTATDGVGTGVSAVGVSVAREDGRWWNGTAWQSTQAWLPASSSDWFDHWSCAWALEPGQDREHTYSLAWRAVDAVTNEATSGPVVTGLRVDNSAPRLLSVYQADTTHVRAVFGEAVAPASVVATAFSVGGLGVCTSASVAPTAPAEVLVETAPQVIGQTYTLTAGTGAVADAYGNRSQAASDAFTAFTGLKPFLTVAQGSGPGRPSAPFCAAERRTVVVDQVVVGAHTTTVTAATLTIEPAGPDAASFASEVSTVSLVCDLDGDGRISAGDTTVSAAAAGASVGLSCGGPVSAEETRALLVVYTLSGTAADGRVIGSRVGTAAVEPPAEVDPFAAIVSAGSGGTVRVDAAFPSVALSAPASGAVLIGRSTIVSGTAADAVSGLASMSVCIRRDDGKYWNGGAWSSGQAWNTVAEGAKWTYAWALDPGQARERVYGITVGASDAVGHRSTCSVTGVRIENTVPTMTAAFAPDGTHVDVTFSERLATASVTPAVFRAEGLAFSAAVLRPGGLTARLTMSGARPGSRYRVTVVAGGVRDVAGNGCEAGSALFIAPGCAREAGLSRYETCVEVSRATWASGQCTNAVLATGDGFADALAASGLAGTVRGPLMLTRAGSLSSAVTTELARLGVQKVWLVGGTKALSPSIVASLATIGYQVERVAGADRYGTAAAIAAKVAALRGPAFAGRAFLARGDEFADALAVSPASCARGFPVLLTRTTSLPTVTAGAIASLGVRDVIVAGGPGAVSDAVVARVAELGAAVSRESGADRYATAAQVASRCVSQGWLDDEFLGVATGSSFADALSGGVSAGAKGCGLLLTDPKALSPAVKKYVVEHPSLKAIAVYGGPGAVTDSVLAQIAALL